MGRAQGRYRLRRDDDFTHRAYDMIGLPFDMLAIDQLRSPHGALLRYEGCRLLLHGRQLTVSPPDGDDQVFDLDEREAVVDLLVELRDRIANRVCIA